MAERLVTVTSRALRDAGLAHDEASCDAAFDTYCTMHRAQHPDEVDITFVYVRQSIWPEDRAKRAAAAEAAGPGVAQEAPGDLDGPRASPGVDRINVMRNEKDHQSDQDVRTPSPSGRSAAMPATLDEIEASRAQAKLAAQAPAGLDLLGLRLPERGIVFYQLAHVARILGVQATLLPGGAVRLEGKWGKGDYGSFASAAQALNARSFKP